MHDKCLTREPRRKAGVCVKWKANKSSLDTETFCQKGMLLLLTPITKLSSLHLHSLIRRPKTEFNYSSQEVGLLASISPLFNKDAKVALKKGPPDSGCCQEALNLIWVCPSLPPQLQDPWSAVSETVKDVIRQTEPLSLVTSMYLVTSLPTVQHQSNEIFIAVKTFSSTSPEYDIELWIHICIQKSGFDEPSFDLYVTGVISIQPWNCERLQVKLILHISMFVFRMRTGGNIGIDLWVGNVKT